MKVDSYRGYEIHYDTLRHIFFAQKNNERITEAASQEELERDLDKIIKKRFERISVIRRSHRETLQGDITSWSKDVRSYGGYAIEVWFVYKDQKGNPRRTKLSLRDNFYLATEKNLKTHEKIKALVEKKRVIEVKIDKLQSRLEEKLTVERFEKMVA